jgi:hypothetical protein
VTELFGLARPAITALPRGLIRTTSKVGPPSAGLACPAVSGAAAGFCGGVAATAGEPTVAVSPGCCGSTAAGSVGSAAVAGAGADWPTSALEGGAAASSKVRLRMNAARIATTPIAPTMTIRFTATGRLPRDAKTLGST